MNTDHIARAAAELDQAIKHAQERLRQLQAARAALDPFVSSNITPNLERHHIAPAEPAAGQTPKVQVSGHPLLAYTDADITDFLGPSEVVERIFRANPGREMTFKDIEAELQNMNITTFGRDQVRGAVYYGRRSGWAEHGTRRGQWRLRDTSAPEGPGAEGTESKADSSSDESDATQRTGGGSVDSAPLPSRDEDEF